MASAPNSNGPGLSSSQLATCAALLGLPRATNLTAAQVKAAFRAAAAGAHPDAGGDAAVFTKLDLAQRVLRASIEGRVLDAEDAWRQLALHLGFVEEPPPPDPPWHDPAPQPPPYPPWHDPAPGVARDPYEPIGLTEAIAAYPLGRALIKLWEFCGPSWTTWQERLGAAILLVAIPWAGTKVDHAHQTHEVLAPVGSVAGGVVDALIALGVCVVGWWAWSANLATVFRPHAPQTVAVATVALIVLGLVAWWAVGASEGHLGVLVGFAALWGLIAWATFGSARYGPRWPRLTAAVNAAISLLLVAASAWAPAFAWLLASLTFWNVTLARVAANVAALALLAASYSHPDAVVAVGGWVVLAWALWAASKIPGLGFLGAPLRWVASPRLP